MKWTPEKISELRALAPTGLGRKEIAMRLGATESAIDTYACRHNISIVPEALAERLCGNCKRVLVRRDGERLSAWMLRRHCDGTCKAEKARWLARERVQLREHIRANRGVEPDFRPHEVLLPRDGGWMARIDRPLPARSLTGSTADW